MQTRITARRFDVSDGLRAHIENSVGSLGRYFDGIQGAHVILDGHDSNGAGKIAEVTVTVPRRGQLRAEQVASTHQEAVRGAVRQLRRQVVRYKDEVKDRKKDRYR
jgi:putative sigma-54 modulation protein